MEILDELEIVERNIMPFESRKYSDSLDDSPCVLARKVSSRGSMKALSNLCFVLGLASVLGSIAIWYYAGGKDATFEVRTHGELFGIFVGLWAPTLLILSNRIARYVEEKK